MKELCGLFIIMSAVAALIDKWSPNDYCQEMLAGIRSVVWGCILTGLAKGIIVIMNHAQIMDTIIYALGNLLEKAPSAISAQLMLVAHTLINFLIPSGSGQAAATMPIMAPLADVLGVSRQVACLTLQFGDGLSNLLWPTCGIVIICGLRVMLRYDRWLKWSGRAFPGCLFAAPGGAGRNRRADRFLTGENYELYSRSHYTATHRGRGHCVAATPARPSGSIRAGVSDDGIGM